MATTIPSIVGGQIERYMPADRTTWLVTAAQAFTGGRLVEGTAAADRAGRTAQADSLVAVGVALFDGAAGARVTVAHTGAWMIVASGAINCGQRVKAGAAGVVVPIAADGEPRFIIGYALAAIADTVAGPIKLLL